MSRPGRKHPRESLGQRAIPRDGQPAGVLGGTDRLPAEGDRAQRGDVSMKAHGWLCGAAPGDLHRAGRHDHGEPVTVDVDSEGGIRRGGRVERGLQREQQSIGAHLARRSDRLAATPAAKLEQHRLQRAAAFGELVDRDAGRGVEYAAADDSGVFEVAQPLRQDVRADRAQAAAQLEEPLRPEDQLADHKNCPPVADAVKRSGYPARVVVAPRARHVNESSAADCFLVSTDPRVGV